MMKNKQMPRKPQSFRSICLFYSLFTYHFRLFFSVRHISYIDTTSFIPSIITLNKLLFFIRYSFLSASIFSRSIIQAKANIIPTPNAIYSFILRPFFLIPDNRYSDFTANYVEVCIILFLSIGI